MTSATASQSDTHPATARREESVAGEPAGVAESSTERKQRVCHLSMTLLTGGLERLLVDFGRRHDDSKYELRFIALGPLGPPAEELRQLGFSVDTLRFGEVGKLSMLKSLAMLLKSEQIDILHTHNTYAHFYGAMAARWAGVKVVINSQHGRGCGNGWKDRLLFRIANRSTQHVVGVSQDAARLCSQQDQRSAAKTKHIWNGIDVERFAFHGPAETTTAISVARLSKEKDYGTLLRGVAIARPHVPEFRLQLVGNGAERQPLEQLAQELGLTDIVEFLGERSDVPELLRRAGFFVSSSKTEGVSLTLLEAMAVGLPVLTTRVGGNPEVVEDGKTGHLVEPLNPEAIAAGIVQMCREKDLWPVMGQFGRQRVEQHFEITQMIRQYEALYASSTLNATR